MIKSFITRIAQSIMIVAIIYASGFVLMEETSEKNERVESEVEAIHSDWSQRRSKKKTNKSGWKQNHPTGLSQQNHSLVNNFSSNSNYNIDFIYHTSYLDSSYLV